MQLFMFEFVPKGSKAVIFNCRVKSIEYLDTSTLTGGVSTPANAAHDIIYLCLTQLLL